MKRTTRRGAKRQAKRGRTYQCRFGPSPRRRPKSASIYARLPQQAWQCSNLGGGARIRPPGPQCMLEAPNGGCDRSSLFGILAIGSRPMSQWREASCRGVNKTENLLILCSLEYCSLEFCFLLVDKARLALSSYRKQKYQNGNIH